MSTEPDNLVLQLLREMRTEMTDVRANMATKDESPPLGTNLRLQAGKGFQPAPSTHQLQLVVIEIAAAKAELRSEIRDVASDLIVTRKVNRGSVQTRQPTLERPDEMRQSYAAAILGAFIAVSTADAGAATLDAVRQRGQLVCGANAGLAGFGLPDEKGHWSGFDIDYCRALAAAVLGEADKVKYVPLSAKDRFTALQSSEIDVLPRNTTWTLNRETGGFLFAATNYYDGQGFMVKKSLGVSSAGDLDGASICVQQGTSNELNLSDFFRSLGKNYQILTLATIGETKNAYEGGRCDALTSDASQLYGIRLALKNPDEHVVLPQIISKEPLAIAVRQGDDQWFNVVKWTYFVLVQAEESSVTQANVDEMVKSDKPDIKRLLGTEGDFGKQLGLDNQWAYRAIKQVGNYGEIFDRNLGTGSPLKIERGLNDLWTSKGLHYAPPIR